MTNKQLWLLAIGILTVAAVVSADPALARPLHENQHFDVNAYSEGDGWIISDTNGDGMTDYALKLDNPVFKSEKQHVGVEG